MVFSARDGWIGASVPRHRREGKREREKEREEREERDEKTERERRGGKRETEKQRAEERTRVLRRCAVTDDPYFQMYCIPLVLLSALVCSASSEIPVAMACRRSGSRVVLCAA